MTLLPKKIDFALAMTAAAMINTSTVARATVLFHGAHGPIVKYDIKSGIITYDRLESRSGVAERTREILYFDDYGMTEAREIYDMSSGSPKLRERDFGKGAARYHCVYETMTAAWSDYDSGGVVPRYDLKEGSPAVKKDENYKELADDTICGKPCNGCSCSPSGESEILIYGWNHIIMKMSYNYPSTGNALSLVATNVQENVPIPPEMFQVPDGMQTPMGK